MIVPGSFGLDVVLGSDAGLDEPASSIMVVTRGGEVGFEGAGEGLRMTAREGACLGDRLSVEITGSELGCFADGAEPDFFFVSFFALARADFGRVSAASAGALRTVVAGSVCGSTDVVTAEAG